ncbi:MAG TPA: hypothetical protein VII06_12295 [Chloroflexota bacterium]
MFARTLVALLTSLALWPGAAAQAKQATPDVATLLNAPGALTIGDDTLRLETHLIRDAVSDACFGTANCPAPPMSAIVLVHTSLGREFPAGVDATHLWVIRGTDVWDTGFAPTESRLALDGVPDARQWIARNGPAWEPAPDVSAVVQIRLGNGSLSLLRQSEVSITIPE